MGRSVLSSMSRVPSDDVLDSLCKLRIRESDQLKTAFELYEMEIHQKISMPTYPKYQMMMKRSTDQNLRLRNLFPRQTRENRNRSSGQELKGLNFRWKRKRYEMPVERKRPVFEGRPVQFPAWEWWSCTKTDTESRFSLWAINDTR